MLGLRWTEVSFVSKRIISGLTAADQAAAWFARRRSGTWSEEINAEFAAWLKEDPSHVAAWVSVEKLWGKLEVVRDNPQVLAMREHARLSAARGRKIRRTWCIGGSVAASFMIAIAAWWSIPHIPVDFLHPPKVAPAGAAAIASHTLVRVASTEIGERSLLVLPDGSRITLNTSSVVHADYSGRERRISLVSGEAYFEVAKNTDRPFVVSAGSRQVIAVGTAFDVRLDERQMQVTLVEGKVRIQHAAPAEPAASPVMLEAGSALVVPESGVDQVRRLDTARLTSWRNGRLVFDGERLGDVIAEMNRYSREKLAIADSALEDKKVSGVFESTGGAGFAKALEAYGIAQVTQQTATTITLDSPR
jgi:transmembrane sensor